MRNVFDPTHPHERRGVPPVLDTSDRCMVCAAESGVDRLANRLAAEITSHQVLCRAVHEAHLHDRECEEEGEGACCYGAWRAVLLLVNDAQCVTPEDEALLTNAMRPL